MTGNGGSVRAEVSQSPLLGVLPQQVLVTGEVFDSTTVETQEAYPAGPI